MIVNIGPGHIINDMRSYASLEDIGGSEQWSAVDGPLRLIHLSLPLKWLTTTMVTARFYFCIQ